jgi:CDP-diacylglycerol--glycerol-3-phosphate 3-phosphatidyltransferase
VVIVVTGILSDIFDGILARRLGVSTPALRRYDSVTDLIFWLCILAATWRVAPEVIRPNGPQLMVLLASEVVCMAASLLRFRRFPATHSYLAKAYGVALAIVFILLLGAGGPAWLVPGLVMLGLAANAEVLAILLLSETAPVDVPTFFHAAGARAQKENAKIGGD